MSDLGFELGPYVWPGHYTFALFMVYHLEYPEVLHRCIVHKSLQQTLLPVLYSWWLSVASTQTITLKPAVIHVRCVYSEKVLNADTLTCKCFGSVFQLLLTNSTLFLKTEYVFIIVRGYISITVDIKYFFIFQITPVEAKIWSGFSTFSVSYW